MCHQMASGASTAIEDAAVLAECLNWCGARDRIPQAVKAYQDIRKPRAERIQLESHRNADELLAPPGPLRAGRDQRYRKRAEEERYEFSLSDDERRALPRPKPDINGRFVDQGSADSAMIMSPMLMFVGSWRGYTGTMLSKQQKNTSASCKTSMFQSSACGTMLSKCIAQSKEGNDKSLYADI